MKLGVLLSDSKRGDIDSVVPVAVTMGKIEWAMWANEQALAAGLSKYKSRI